MLGALLVGTAVADTIAGIVRVAPSDAVSVIGSGLLGATLWNVLTWWRGLPSSSGHALVGGLVGAAVAEGGIHAVRWGGLSGLKPVGAFGVLIALAVSPPLGLAFGAAFARLNERVLRRATREVRSPIRVASGRCPAPYRSATAPTTRRRRWESSRPFFWRVVTPTR